MNINPYLYIFGAFSMISPLVFAFFALDFDNWTAFWITFVIYVIINSAAAMMFNYLETGNAFKSSPGRKWELVQENKRMIETQFNPLWGMGTMERKVIADVYRRQKRDGTYKYKTIVKS